MNKTYTIVMAMCNKEDRAKSPIREAEIIVPEEIKKEEIQQLVQKFMRETGHPVLITGIFDYQGTEPVVPLFTIKNKT